MEKPKELGLTELIAIAIGGMIGGGIFTILGVSASIIGSFTPIAIIIGGMVAALASYSYVKLALYFKDEGASYSFFKKTFPLSPFLASAIGWLVTFGYISTLALYAYTFSSYSLSGTVFSESVWVRKLLAITVVFVFALVNIWSVKGMGKLEDFMVYSKLFLLGLISFVLIRSGDGSFTRFSADILKESEHANVINILIVASLTFVAYQGFQLVINAQNTMSNPSKNIPRAIYTAIVLVIFVYVIVSLGALFAVPIQDLIKNKEYALAAGASKVIGGFGSGIVILSALLATSSAISGTLFGSSRQLSIIARDGYFPKLFAERKNDIPVNALLLMAIVASVLILSGGLELILEFGSITFLLVSLLTALANFKLRKETNSSTLITFLAIITLFTGSSLILYYEFQTKWIQMIAIILIYIILIIFAWLYAKKLNILDTPVD